MVRRLLTQMLLNLRQILTAKDTIASPTTTANCVHATTTTTPTITITRGVVSLFKRYSTGLLRLSTRSHCKFLFPSFPPTTKLVDQTNPSIFFFFFFLPSTKHKTNYFFVGPFIWGFSIKNFGKVLSTSSRDIDGDESMAYSVNWYVPALYHIHQQDDLSVQFLVPIV